MSGDPRGSGSGAGPEFVAPVVLRSGHLMTAAALLTRRRIEVLRGTHRRRLFRVDADTRVLAICHWQPQPRRAPTLLLVHGLVGSADTNYMLGTAAKAYAAGFNAVRLNVRSCGDGEDLSPTLYHAGLTADLEAVSAELTQRDGLGPLYGAGFSLGGNMVLKWAATRAPTGLRGVAAVSTPIDLVACAETIDSPGAFLYRRYFLRLMRGRIRRKAALWPRRFDATGVEGLKTFREFDGRYVAPAFGFGTAERYYREASSAPDLPRLPVPALLVAARDDPIVPHESYRRAEVNGSPQVTLLAPHHGGHCGFVGRAPAAEGPQRNDDRYWAENRVVRFFCTLEGKHPTA